MNAIIIISVAGGFGRQGRRFGGHGKAMRKKEVALELDWQLDLQKGRYRDRNYSTVLVTALGNLRVFRNVSVQVVSVFGYVYVYVHVRGRYLPMGLWGKKEGRGQIQGRKCKILMGNLGPTNKGPAICCQTLRFLVSFPA